jgi:trimeric autotransporter adhesin
VAGTGSYGYSGDGGQATSAALYYPYGVAVDASGNIYIADTDNERIRMVTKSTGIISTVAGTGSSGSSGDGGQASSAALRNPYGVALDASGNIYIADTYNHRIRMVTKSTGIISTVAGTGSSGYSGDGGQATSVALRSPQGVAVDASGNIYIADTDNERIRMVTKSTGIISTVAGTGSYGYSGDGGQATSAALSYPRGITVDASGNIYIADNSNHRIRMVTKSTGIISTVAGTGSYSYSGDGGQATSAALYYPYGVALDASGNIYIADTYNNRIRMVTKSTGIISTVAGTGSFSYSGDGGQATSAVLKYPYGVAVDASGNIYIADTYNNRIRMFALSASPAAPPSPSSIVTSSPAYFPTPSSIVTTRPSSVSSGTL